MSQFQRRKKDCISPLLEYVLKSPNYLNSNHVFLATTILFFFPFFSSVLGFELKASCLPGRCNITLTQLQLFFALGFFFFFFFVRICHLCPGLALDQHIPTYTSSVAGMTGI
jgi:hypothetical protein